MYTPDSPLLGQPQATEAQCSAYMLHRKHSDAYSEIDIADIIVPTYFSVCSIVELDAVLLLSQMIHETGNLTSWWSQRPRRNPAGIGCDGDPKAHEADGKPGGFNTDRAKWEHGLSFATWANDSIPAHVGRVLAFVLPVNTGTPSQRKLIAKAVSYRPFPIKARGTAQFPRQLGTVHNSSGIGWAKPGDFYGDKILTIANSILHPIAE